MAWAIGEACIARVEEQRIEVPIALITGDRDLIERGLGAWPPEMLDPGRETFQLVTQSWIVRVDGLIVVVDPCNGNGRIRDGFPHFEQLDLPWLERFAETGTRPEDVDIVFCTHLHCDHCGWNTRRQDGRWVPTFPNARYLFVRREVDRWNPANDDRLEEPEYNRTVFDESVEPILKAGLAELIETPYQLSASLRIEASEGHTQGHALLRLESAGEIAYFSGDVMHHPVQILEPALHMPGCDDLSKAIATRESLIARVLAEAAWLVPAHFGSPHHGRVIVDGDGCLDFQPGGLPDRTSGT